MTVYILLRPPYPNEYITDPMRVIFEVKRVYLYDICHIVSTADSVVAVGRRASEFLAMACGRPADKVLRGVRSHATQRRCRSPCFNPGDVVIVVLLNRKFLESPTDKNARFYIYRVRP